MLWHRFDAYIDPYLAKGQLIMVDTEGAFPAPLFSRYPGQWVIPSDRDFQSLAENFSGQFQWLLQTPAASHNFGGRGGRSAQLDDRRSLAQGQELRCQGRGALPLGA